MRNNYIIFFIFVLFFIFIYSNSLLAQENQTEIGINIGIIYRAGTDSASFPFSELYYNPSFPEGITSEFIPTSIFYMISKKYFFYIFSFESFLSDFNSGPNYMFFSEIGFGLYYSLGPIIIRLFLNNGLGVYFLKILYVFYDENRPLIGKPQSDFLIYLEPNVAVGLKLNKSFIFYFGINQKYSLFFKTQIECFKPFQYYIMLSYIL